METNSDRIRQAHVIDELGKQKSALESEVGTDSGLQQKQNVNVGFLNCLGASLWLLKILCQNLYPLEHYQGLEAPIVVNVCPTDGPAEWGIKSRMRNYYRFRLSNPCLKKLTVIKILNLRSACVYALLCPATKVDIHEDTSLSLHILFFIPLLFYPPQPRLRDAPAYLAPISI